jgi:hypothetical protein
MVLSHAARVFFFVIICSFGVIGIADVVSVADAFAC